MSIKEFGQRARSALARAMKSPPVYFGIPSEQVAALKRKWPHAPSLREPVSQMCTYDQFESEEFSKLCGKLGSSKVHHRKQWEFAYILASLEKHAMLGPGKKGLGFAVGREPLSSVFASRGVSVVATDLGSENRNASGWATTSQHAASLDAVYVGNMLPQGEFERLVQFRPVDMKAIPADIEGFDFCWSSCALEHLGTLQDGIDFIWNSLDCLAPGGVAVHTTEFTLSSATQTIEAGRNVAYRESDICSLAEALEARGHSIELNLHPGSTPEDSRFSRDRSALPHIRLPLGKGVIATSFGMTIRKRA